MKKVVKKKAKKLKNLKPEDVFILSPKKNYYEELNKKHDQLLVNIKKGLPELEKLLEKISGHWTYEDMIYRYYHQSYKVYHVQCETLEIVLALTHLAPDGCTLNEQFDEIFKEGTGKEFKHEHNSDWDKHTRPLLEAFFHAKFFLEMAVKYGKELEKAPECLPSGWAAFLYLFNLR